MKKKKKVEQQKKRDDKYNHIYDQTGQLVTKVHAELDKIQDKSILVNWDYTNDFINKIVERSSLDEASKILIQGFIVESLPVYIAKNVSLDACIKFWGRGAWKAVEINSFEDNEYLNFILSKAQEIIENGRDKFQIQDQDFVNKILTRKVDDQLIMDLFGLVKNEQGHLLSPADTSFKV